MNEDSALTLSRSATARRTAGWLSHAWYLFWKILLSTLFKVLFRYRVEGREYEPAHGPFIAAANHASAIDPPLVGLELRRRAAYMAKAELFAIPVLSAWLRSVGTFPVRRGQPDRAAIRRSQEVLTSGGVLVMFPEGTRSEDGRLQPAEPGAARLALRTGAPVLPVAVINSHRIMPKGARWPRLQPVTVRLGPPIPVPKVNGRLDPQVLDEWGRRIMAEIERLLPPDQRPLRR